VYAGRPLKKMKRCESTTCTQSPGTPLSIHGKLIGVLDIDSPQTARFSEADQAGVELLCGTFVQKLENDLEGPADFI
jgi:putative methionine-R-sulfoxide reductase with GAF domain